MAKRDAIVDARIDRNFNPPRVILKGNFLPDQPKPGDTFLVDTNDTLTWALKDKDGNDDPKLGRAIARVTFVVFPTTGHLPLLNEGNTLFSSGNKITGTVNSGAPNGHYEYIVDVIDPPSSPGKITNLVCFWESDAVRTGMGGGEKGPHT